MTPRVRRSIERGVLLGVWLGALAAALRAPARGPGGPGVTGTPDAPLGVEILSGTVVDGAGGPLAGAVVSVTPTRAGTPARTGTSDAAGAFRVDGLDAGAHRVELSGTAAAAALTVPVPGPPVVIAAARLVPIEGRVRGLAPGPIEVELAGEQGTRTIAAAADGAFSAHVPEGAYAVGARAGLAASPPALVERFGAGPFAPLELELAPAGALGVLARGDDGQPIAGARLRVVSLTGDGLERAATTDAGGRARVEGLAPGEWTVDGDAAERLPAGAVVAIDAGADATLELVLERAAIVTGRAVDEHGAPIAGAAVAWTGATASPTRGRLVLTGELGVLRGPVPYPPPIGALVAVTTARLDTAPTDRAAAAPAPRTDAAGRFELGGLAPGAARVALTHPARAPGASAPVALAAGGTVDVGDVTLRPGTEVTVLVSAGGRPIAGAFVEASAGDVTIATAVADAQGRATLGHLVGPITLRATSAGVAPTALDVDVPDGGAPMTIELAPPRLAARLTLRVDDPDGRPVPDVLAVVSVDGAEAARGVARTGGRVEVDAPDGPCVLLVRAPGHVPTQRRLASPPRDLVTITLARAGAIALDVRDAATRTPLSDGVVEAVHLGAVPADALAPAPASARVLGGVARLGDLVPGRWRLTVATRGYASHTLDVEVTAPRDAGAVTATTRVELTAAATLSGRVVDAHGDPAVDVDVRAAGVTARTDATGTFRLDAIPPGEITIEAVVAGRVAGTTTARVRSGDELTTLLVRLAP